MLLCPVPQTSPALELTSEEQELAGQNAVIDDRMMAESSAADLLNAQSPLPSGQDSAAGEGLLLLLGSTNPCCMVSGFSGQNCVVGDRP